ncbi:MAG TPA: SDR family oxidoreductase [Polyangiales bacterium]|nr:SDR family oxidoreductase [Polyangiales bacterium]
MATFVTGSTGYLGSYVTARLLQGHREQLALLVRARDPREAEARLWTSLQLHLPFAPFAEYLRSRVEIYLGDITLPRLGMSARDYDRLVAKTDSIVHIAASLNRRSERLCTNVNLRGTLEVLRLARAAHDLHGLRRFSDVSTTAVAGERSSELVQEDQSIDWERRDYDPYARTKKFCEHMVETLLPDVPVTVFRPATVIGDTRFGATTQFDMIRAVLMLARMRLLPLRPDSRHDIVPADYVGRAIADIHQLEAPRHRIYHLSAGDGAETHAQLMERLRLRGQPISHRFAPGLEQSFGTMVSALAQTPRSLGVSNMASLLNVFWPYVTYDTVFDNRRVVEELGEAPRSFGEYGSRVLDFALDHNFVYPYQRWPEGQPTLELSSSAA